MADPSRSGEQQPAGSQPAPDDLPPSAEASIERMAMAIKPRGILRKYVNGHPRWGRRIGADVSFRLAKGRPPHPTEVPLLREAYAQALHHREQLRQLAETVRRLKAKGRW